MNNQQIIEFFNDDKYAAMTGVKIDHIDDKNVICSLEIKDFHFNAGNRVQGGAIFTLADFTFAVACNYNDLREGQQTITVNQSCNMTFFNTPNGTKLISKSECLQKGKKLSVYRMTVTDDLDNIIAEMLGNAYTVNIR